MEGQTIQCYKRKSNKEVIRSVNGRTDNTLVLKKTNQRGNQKRISGTDNTMELKKKYQRGNQKL
jgi:hypothetical protein